MSHSDEDESFKETADVCASYKSILKSYPLGNGNIREILQNADDAGSRKQIFVLDYRNHPTQSLLDPKLACYQGPSLISINDGIFTPEDWKAITTLNLSSKLSDASKAGKFGIGFRSCYHLTDSPNIISGDFFAFLDPHCEIRNPDRSDGGRKIRLNKVKADYSDQLAPFSGLGLPEINEHFDGTIFRFPLRTAEVLRRSRISNDPLPPSRLRHMFENFIADEISECLFFLRNLESVEFKIVTAEGKLELLASVSIENPESIRSLRAIVPAANGEMPTGFRSFKFGLKTTIAGQSIVNNWQLVHFIESARKCATAIQDIIIAASDSSEANISLDQVAASLKQEKLYGWTAIAAPLKPIEHFTGFLFNILKLPLRTAFPVHVHALLALDPSRQHLLNPAEGILEGSRHALLQAWNQAVFEVIMPKAYTELIRQVASSKQSIYRYLPSPSAEYGDVVWNELPSKVIDILMLRTFPVWPTTKDRFLTISEVMLASPNMDPNIASILQQLGLKIVSPPQDLYHHLATVKRSVVTLLSPERAATAIKLDRCNLGQIKSKKSKLHLLEYLSANGQALKNIVNLQLVPLADGNFTAIDSYSSSTPAEFLLVTSQERALFPKWLSRMIDIADLPFNRTIAQIEKLQQLQVTSMEGSHALAYLSGHQGDYIDRSVSLDHAVKILKWLHGRKVPSADLRATVATFKLLPTTMSVLVQMNSRVLSNSILSEPQTRWLQDHNVNVLHPDLASQLNWLTRAGFIAAEADALQFVLQSFREYPLPYLQDGERKHLQRVLINLFALAHSSSIPPPPQLIKPIQGLPIWPVVTVINGSTQLQPLPEQHYFISHTGLLPILSDYEFVLLTDDNKHLAKAISRAANSPLREVDLLAKAVENWDAQKQKAEFVERVVARIGDLSNIPGFFDNFKEIPLVQVDGSSVLKKAADVIDPESEIASLYSFEEHIFPSPTAFKSQTINLLKAYGLIPSRFSTDIYRNRLDYYTSRPSSSSDRSKKILRLLDLLTRYFSPSYSQVDASRLLHLLVSAADNSLSGNTQSNRQVRDQRDSFLFDRVLPIIPRNVFSQDVRRYLGWHKDPILDIIYEQLDRCVDASDRDSIVKVLRHLANEYGHVNHNALGDRLAGKNWIPTNGNSLQSVERVLLREKLLPGYFQVDPLLAIESTIKPFLRNLGCQDEPDINALLASLNALQQPSEAMNLAQRISAAIKLIEIVLELGVDDEQLQDIPIPNSFGSFTPVKSIFYDDSKHSSGSKTHATAHGRISRDLADKLRLRSLSDVESDEIEFEDDEDEEEDFEQKEKTVTQIKNTLNEYQPDSLANEIIANAVDSHAITVTFLLDEMDHSNSGNLLSPECSQLQGAALVIHNDGIFADRDWKGFLAMGEGGKVGLSGQTGRYGKGSQTMYHYSDTITILSRDYFAISDPQRTLLPRARDRRQRRAGIKVNLRKGIQHRLEGHLHAVTTLFGFDPSMTYNGTLFRLPLRTSQSEMSTSTYSPADAVAALQRFHTSASQSFFFTKSLVEVKAQRRDAGGNIHDLWSVKCQRKPWTTSLQSPIVFATTPYSNEVNITSSKGGEVASTSRWLVVEAAFSEETVPAHFHDLVKHRKLPNPTTSIAASIPTKEKKKVDLLSDLSTLTSTKPKPKANMFSTMLISDTRTTLPVNIHSAFMLSSDRRNIRMESPESQAEAAYNQFLLQKLVSPLYLRALAILAECESVKAVAYRDLWPTEDNTDLVTTTVMKTIYNELILSTNEPILHTIDHQRIPPKHATFSRSRVGAVSRLFETLEVRGFVNFTPFKVTNLTPQTWMSLNRDTPTHIGNLINNRAADLQAAYASDHIDGKELATLYMHLRDTKTDDYCKILDQLALIPCLDGTLRSTSQQKLFVVQGKDLNIFGEIEQLKQCMVETKFGEEIKPVDKSNLQLFTYHNVPYFLRTLISSADVAPLASVLAFLPISQRRTWLPDIMRTYFTPNRLKINDDQLSDLPLLMCIYDSMNKDMLVSSKYAESGPIIGPFLDPTDLNGDLAGLKHLRHFYLLDIASCPENMSFYRFEQLLRALGSARKGSDYVGLSQNHYFNALGGFVQRKLETQASMTWEENKEVLRDLPMFRGILPDGTIGNVSAQNVLIIPTYFTLEAIRPYLIPGRTQAYIESPLASTSAAKIFQSYRNPLPFPTFFRQHIILPQTISQATEFLAYDTLLQQAYTRVEFTLHKYRDDYRILEASSCVPNAAGRLCLPSELYTRNNVFAAAFDSVRAERFPHDQIMDTIDQYTSLFSKTGYNTSVTEQSWLLAAQALQNEILQAISDETYSDIRWIDLCGRAERVFAFIRDNDRLAIPWPTISALQIVPSKISRRSASIASLGYDPAEYAIDLPKICSLSQLTSENYERTCWSQRAICAHEPLAAFSTRYPEFGKPSRTDLIRHLELLVEKIFPRVGEHQVLANDLKAIYHALASTPARNNQTDCFGKKVFLNVRDPSTDTWVFHCPSELAFGILMDLPNQNPPQMKVKAFLADYRELLVKQGAKDVHHEKPEPRSQHPVYETIDLSHGMWQNRADGALTDVEFKCSDNVIVKAHRIALYTKSEHFKAMFQGVWLEQKQIELSIRSEPLLLIFQFLYLQGELSIERRMDEQAANDLREVLLEVLQAADMWIMQDLKPIIEDRLMEQDIVQADLTILRRLYQGAKNGAAERLQAHIEKFWARNRALLAEGELDTEPDQMEEMVQ